MKTEVSFLFSVQVVIILYLDMLPYDLLCRYSFGKDVAGAYVSFLRRLIDLSFQLFETTQCYVTSFLVF